MSSGNINWKILAALTSAGMITRKIIQQRRSIDFKGKVVLITGGSRGLGLALAETFALEGAKLVLCARDEQELAHARMMVSEQGAETFTIAADIADPQQAAHAVERATAHFGRIDVLVNNAGVIMAGPWRTLTRQDFEEAMNIMFWGTYNMTMETLPQMAERKQGRIVNISSIGGRVSVPHLLPYSSAKFAITGFSDGLRAELSKENIFVTTVAPGLMRTGSTVNTVMKGDEHRREYTLFTLLDTLPTSSTSVRHAAKKIVQATRYGDAELIITLPAQLMARLYGAFPGLVVEALSLVDRFLPSGKGAGTQRYAGRESETSITRSFLTKLGRQATKDYNEDNHPRN